MKFRCCAQSKDYGYILDNGKEAGKVKSSKINADWREDDKRTKNKLIKQAVNTVVINYNKFHITYCEVFTKHMVKQWAFKFDKKMIRTIS